MSLGIRAALRVECVSIESESVVPSTSMNCKPGKLQSWSTTSPWEWATHHNMESAQLMTACGIIRIMVGSDLLLHHGLAPVDTSPLFLFALIISEAFFRYCLHADKLLPYVAFSVRSISSNAPQFPSLNEEHETSGLTFVLAQPQILLLSPKFLVLVFLRDSLY